MTAHAAFAAALLDPDVAVPAGLTAWNGADPMRRFAVYRNNVTTALTGVLADSFPVTQQLVGEDFFCAMARVFLRAHPPRSPLLHEYGHDFPAFVAQFEPARQVPYLADMARLEWLRLAALHAADAPVLAADDIAPLLADPAALPGLRLALHPAAAVLQSAHAVVSLWGAHHGVGALAEVDPYAAESALVLRPMLEVLVLRLPPGGGIFAAALAAETTLGEAAAAASADPSFDLAENLALLIRHGALGALRSSARS